MSTQIKGIETRRKMGITIISAVLICCALFLTGCSSKDNIVGTWSSEDGTEVLTFDSNGTCSVPFTYNGAWLESCNRYSITDDDTLVLSSSRGNIDSQSYTKAESREEAEGNEGSYYLSGDTLVFNRRGKVYSYTKE